MDNFFRQSVLYDIYGKLLDEKQQLVYEYHIIDDLSFNEIGEELNLSRQAAYDLFSRADKKLKSFEEKLGLSKKLIEIENLAEKIKMTTTDNNIKKLSEQIINYTNMEEKNGSKNSFKKIGPHS